MAAQLRGCGAAWGAQRAELSAIQQEGSEHMMCVMWETSALPLLPCCILDVEGFGMLQTTAQQRCWVLLGPCR